MAPSRRLSSTYYLAAKGHDHLSSCVTQVFSVFSLMHHTLRVWAISAIGREAFVRIIKMVPVVLLTVVDAKKGLKSIGPACLLFL